MFALEIGDGQMTTEIAFLAKQFGATILPDNAQWTNRFEIKSETSSRLYIVAQNKANGQFGCSCMGWKRHRHCKHLRNMAPMLANVGRVK
jgi:hypothetical protein